MTEDPAAIIRYSVELERRVAGLSLLERAVLALRRGGVREVAVSVPDEQRDALVASLAQGRLRDAPPALVAPGPGRADPWRAGSPRLLVDRPVALDPTFVAAAVKAIGERSEPMRLADGVMGLPAGAPLGHAPSDGAPLSLPGTALVVTSSAGARQARRALLAQSIKPLEIDGLVCWLLVRRLSVRLSALLLALPLTPNHITLASILLGVAAALSVAVGTWAYTAAGGAILLLSLILDNCDGEVARVKHLGSTFGAWLDIYGDFVVNAAFLAGMAVGAYRAFDAPVYLWAGGFSVFAFAFYNGTVFRYIHRLGVPDEFLFRWWFDQEAEAAAQPAPAAAAQPAPAAAAQPAPAAAARPSCAVTPAPEEKGPSGFGRFLSALKYLGRRDFFIFAYFVTALGGVLYIAFWATVAGTVMNFVMTCYQVFFWKGLRGQP